MPQCSSSPICTKSPKKTLVSQSNNMGIKSSNANRMNMVSLLDRLKKSLFHFCVDSCVDESFDDKYSFKNDSSKILSNCKIFVSSNLITLDLIQKIANIGAEFCWNFDKNVKHFIYDGILDYESRTLLQTAIQYPSIKIVNSDWILQCIEHKTKINEKNFLIQCAETDFKIL
ncbi:unnamed protein product [Brachionus calyciflorus]|uniref:BRCT domain-containing protein n=1 Tax=Brachionus calyciflorus TaxID=104777 RepID=A0A814B1H0_9BILA|nr:unnamed protein product [Brachionus calyciflorus]